MRLSLGVATSMPIKSSIEYARLAERSGFDRVWVGEDILSREIFTYLSIIALKTKTIGIASGITSPYVRKLTTIASSSAGVQHLSGGRFTLGIGPGGLPEVKKIIGRGAHDVVDVMTETTILIRRILNGETISHHGILACLMDYHISHPHLEPFDIYFGVRGPRLLSLAGKLADGVIFSGPLGYLSLCMKIVEESAKKEGRDPKKIGRAVWNPLFMGKKSDELKSAKRVAATIIASMPEKALEYVDIKPETVEEIRRLFAESRYEEAYSHIKTGVIKEFIIAGTKAEIEEQLEKCRQIGFDEFIVGPPYGESPLKVIQNIGERHGGA